jgi:membrane protein DedA with SNARE-associated domain
MEEILRQYGPIGVFLGAAFEGQSAVILGGLLARQHLLAYWVVLASATAGSGIIDHLLFVAGRRFRTHRWVRWATEKPAFARALRFIERFPNSYTLIFRFIFGLRLASPVAIGVSQVPAWQFAILNMLGALIWAGVFSGAGFVFGEALHSLLGHGHRAGRWTLIAAGVFAAAVVLFWVVRYLRQRRVAHEESPQD